MLKTIYMTFADYWNLKKKEVLSVYRRPFSIEQIVLQFALPAIGTLRISEVTVSDLSLLFRRMREAGYAMTMCHMLKAVLHKLFYLAVEERFCPENPVLKLSAFPTIHLELHQISQQQEIDLLRAFQKTSMPAVYTLLMISGISFSEFAGCRVRNFCESSSTLTITQIVITNGLSPLAHPRNVPLSETAVSLLREIIHHAQQTTLPPDDNPFLLLNHHGHLYQGIPFNDLRIIRKESGLPSFVPGDLKYFYGIRALRFGANPKVLNQYLGYSTGFNLARFTSAGRLVPDANLPAMDGLLKPSDFEEDSIQNEQDAENQDLGFLSDLD